MHCITSSSSCLIPTVKYDILNLKVKSVPPLGRRKRGVSVMLENSPGNYKVEKLRAFLQLEADFNALHKINFNGRLMTSLKDSSSISQEIMLGIMSQEDAYLAFSKELIVDVSNTIKLHAAMIDAYATNCYSQVAHPYASLCY